MKKYYGYAMLAVMVPAFILAAWSAQSQVGSEGRVATVKHIMNAINKISMPKVATSANKQPATPKEWTDLELSAAILNEASFILMENGRRKDDVWEKSCMELRAASAAIAAAAANKSYDGVSENAKKVGGSCKSCHDVHKKAQP